MTNDFITEKCVIFTFLHNPLPSLTKYCYKFMEIKNNCIFTIAIIFISIIYQFFAINFLLDKIRLITLHPKTKEHSQLNRVDYENQKTYYNQIVFLCLITTRYTPTTIFRLLIPVFFERKERNARHTFSNTVQKTFSIHPVIIKRPAFIQIYPFS